MTDPISNVGQPKCPHCFELVPADLTPIRRIQLLDCPYCHKIFTIASRDVEYTTHKTDLDPTDFE